ncbi:MAG: hypothetical protein M0042_07780 [Nitrospiraceae bacterium]|nr:hypothetical protein [Nitrospiraceae bacterium]
MRRVAKLMALVVLGAVLLMSGSAEAVIYKYTNAKGDIVFADDLNAVPQQYRNSAVVVSGAVSDDQERKAEEERALAIERLKAQQQAAPAPAGAPAPAADAPAAPGSAAPAQATSQAMSRLIRTGIAVAVAIVLLVILREIDALRERDDLMRLVRLVILAALIGFLGFNHAGDFMNLFSTVNTAVTDVQKQSEQKGQRVADTIKAAEKTKAEVERQQQEINAFHQELERQESGGEKK